MSASGLEAPRRWLGGGRVRRTARGIVLASSLFGLLTAAASGSVASCPGDCDADGSVTVDEVIAGVAIALGEAPLAACPSMDGNGDGEVWVDEIVAAVGRALDGCEPAASTVTATPTPSAATITPTPDCAAGPCPDLVPGAVNPFFPTPISGCRQGGLAMPVYLMDVCVGNTGAAASDSFAVNVAHLDHFRADGLQPGEFQCYRRTFHPSGTLSIDDQSEVRESNEANNTRSFQLAIPSFAPTCTVVVHTLTPTPTVSPTPAAQCTPPLCSADQGLVCPQGSCAGGCGVICATHTPGTEVPSPTPEASVTPHATCTFAGCPADQVIRCIGDGCVYGCDLLCVTPTPLPEASPTSPPTLTPTSCAGSRPLVEPVAATTTELTTVVRACGRNAGSSRVVVSGPGGAGMPACTHSCGSTCDDYTVPLVPNSTNRIRACQTNGSCPLTVCTDLDRHGAPLDVVQVSGP